jgi:hypothetical protein
MIVSFFLFCIVTVHSQTCVDDVYGTQMLQSEAANLDANVLYNLVVCGTESPYGTPEWPWVVDYKNCAVAASAGQFIVVQYVLNMTVYSTSTTDSYFRVWADDVAASVPYASEFQERVTVSSCYCRLLLLGWQGDNNSVRPVRRHQLHVRAARV